MRACKGAATKRGSPNSSRRDSPASLFEVQDDRTRNRIGNPEATAKVFKCSPMVLADRGYDADWIRALVNEQGAWANIPPKRNRKDPICFSPHLYRARNLVERFFNKVKHCRRVATRYDQLAANYLAFVQLASIRLWLRVYEFTT